jgi:hypothetical protein
VVYSFYISIKSNIGSIYLNAYMSWQIEKLTQTCGKLTDVTFPHIIYIKCNLLHDSIGVGNDLLNDQHALLLKKMKH